MSKTKTLVASLIQLEVLHRMATDGGQIHRWSGGFWSTRPCPDRLTPFPRSWWYVTTGSVQAMEKNGWIERVGKNDQHWRDPRRITPAGRTVLTLSEYSRNKINA